MNRAVGVIVLILSPYILAFALLYVIVFTIATVIDMAGKR
jgi:hypothetical protein